ncbi:DUF742 domain-containing protein [Streptomyces humi]|uniref:DUF742 domain-containing protein n=1 Tax=Streptomyces humi TaxID=1428620 RepID=UPI0006288E92|nr:DUF742 domain-containing protein [Streptomyces humi]
MTASRRVRGPGLVGLHVVTGGRSEPSRNHFDFVTTVRISTPGLDRTGLSPEQRRVLELCQPGALTVAEIGAYLVLPLSVLRVLLADLMERGHITTNGKFYAVQAADREVLEAVLEGLRKL